MYQCIIYHYFLRSGTSASCDPHILFLTLFCYTGFVIDSIIHVCCMILYTKRYTYSPPVAVFFFFSNYFCGCYCVVIVVT